MNDVVWITKYALTAGIFSKLVDERPSHESPGMIVVKSKYGLNGVDLYHGNDWHESLSEAISRAEDMRDAKIKSLRKQIAALEKLEFNADEIRSKDAS